MSVSDIARTLRQPVSSTHRVLSVLRRRGYVRQDDETTRYYLSLKMLDMSFRVLGGSEVRLHAYPVVRDYVLRTGNRAFLALGASGEVTYLWSASHDEVAMRTVYGREMPAHCAMYFAMPNATRRLSCVKLVTTGEAPVLRLGPDGALPDGAQRLVCTCAPIRDYASHEVGRVGVFAHGADERPFTTDIHRETWALARNISLRLGFLPSSMEASA